MPDGGLFIVVFRPMTRACDSSLFHSRTPTARFHVVFICIHAKHKEHKIITVINNTITPLFVCWFTNHFTCTNNAVVQLVEYRTRNREIAGSTHTRSTASNLEQVANLLCAQANSASYPQRDGKWVVAMATGWRPSVADWGDVVSASCTVGPIVR